MLPITSPPKLAKLAAELGYKPVPIHNGKFVRKGDNPTVTYSHTDWLQGETLALRAGRLDDGAYLVRVDLDKHDDEQDPLARLDDIRIAAGDSVFRKLAIAMSTGGLGRDVIFKTPVPLRTMPIKDRSGVLAGEILCEGHNARVNIPTDPRRWPQGSIETIPTLSESETIALLAAFVLPERKSTPNAPALRPRSGSYGDRSLAQVKALVNLIDYLVSQGSRVSRYTHNGATLHCSCQFHKHGDRTPSLSVTTNRAGDLVVFGKSGACLFAQDERGYDVIGAIKLLEGLSGREIIDRYCPANITPAAPSAPAVQLQSTPAAAEPSKDALRKRDERQRQRDATAARRKEQIDGLILPKMARRLAELLIAGHVRTPNNELAKLLKCSKITVQRAFRDLEAAELGKRGPGRSPTIGHDGYIYALWTWADDTPKAEQNDTLMSVHAALDDTLLVLSNSTPVDAYEEGISPAAAAIPPAITDTPLYTRIDLARLLRAYFSGIETGKRASFKQASSYVEDNTPGAFSAELVQEVYNRLMEQRKWDLATRDIPTMDWKVLKREGARARGMAAKLTKQGENAAWFSALANRFDSEIQRRISAGEAPEHYRTRRKSKAPAEPTPIELALSLGDDNALDIPSSKAIPEPTHELVQPEYRVVASNYIAFKQARAAHLV
jgi:hypothetical protein